MYSAVSWSVLSGMAALIYQVLLYKIFSYLLACPLLSAAIMVATYMPGLAPECFFRRTFLRPIQPPQKTDSLRLDRGSDRADKEREMRRLMVCTRGILRRTYRPLESRQCMSGVSA
jgi:hypothetical protein